MESLSPIKRRALAPLDANAKPSSGLKPKPIATPTTTTTTTTTTTSTAASAAAAAANTPLRLFADSRKRTLEDAEDAAAKKPCVEEARSRSPSLDASSVFDPSGGDVSWATATTEADVPAPRRVRLTREEARQRAETLRLRLSLASYKLRTGQIHIPLKDLQRKPLPKPSRVVRVQSPPREDASGETSS